MSKKLSAESKPFTPSNAQQSPTGRQGRYNGEHHQSPQTSHQSRQNKRNGPQPWTPQRGTNQSAGNNSFVGWVNVSQQQRSHHQLEFSLDEEVQKLHEILESEPELAIFSVDVECIASGHTNSDRSVARVAMVDVNENVVFDKLVKPGTEIVSYLTQLTGLEPGSLDNAESLETVREELLAVLPPNSLLVGQAIQHDIHWLNLIAGEHFKYSFDIANFFKSPMRNGRYRFFSLRHEVLYLSGFEGAGNDIQNGVHDPCIDAIYSVRLFQSYRTANASHLHIAQQSLIRAPPTLPLWKTTPWIDGVQMGPARIYQVEGELATNCLEL